MLPDVNDRPLRPRYSILPRLRPPGREITGSGRSIRPTAFAELRQGPFRRPLATAIRQRVDLLFCERLGVTVNAFGAIIGPPPNRVIDGG